MKLLTHMAQARRMAEQNPIVGIALPLFYLLLFLALTLGIPALINSFPITTR